MLKTRNSLQIFWNVIKLRSLLFYKFIYATPPLIRFIWNPYQNGRRVLSFFKLWILNHRDPQNLLFDSQIFLPGKQIVVYYGNSYETIANTLNRFIIFAWLCEKMRINIKIQHPCNVLWRHFENSTITNTTKQKGNNLEKQNKHSYSLRLSAVIGVFSNSSEYGHKILSQLSIKEELKHSANQWFEQHIKKENWVAVHYRGTDAAALKSCKRRYRINLKHYIIYLKEVLDNQCNIFACSDQAQFINKMREAFPGRVAARDIQRSYNSVPLHTQEHNQHGKDALIDILILAKAKLIYTTGSGFIDVVRYFNPKVKIVTLNGQGRGRISGNVLPIPKKDLFKKLRIQ